MIKLWDKKGAKWQNVKEVIKLNESKKGRHFCSCLTTGRHHWGDVAAAAVLRIAEHHFNVWINHQMSDKLALEFINV
mgnify:CR=1 FL=1